MNKNTGLEYPDFDVPINRRYASLEPPSYKLPSHDPLGGYPLQPSNLKPPSYNPPSYINPNNRFVKKNISK